MERRLWFKLGKERNTRVQTMDQTTLLTIERNTRVPSDQTTLLTKERNTLVPSDQTIWSMDYQTTLLTMES